MLSPPDADLVAREPELPGMPLLLDAAALAERLRDLAPELASSPTVPAYVRYKPGTSCLVAYRAAPGAPPTLYAVARRPSDVEKLRKVQRGLSDGGAPVVGVLLEEAIEVRGARADAELHGLARLLDAAGRRQMLAERFAHLPDLAPGGLVPLAYKPERRFVARLEGTGGSSGVLRLYTDYDFAAAAEAAVAFRSRRELRLARCLGKSNRNRVLVLEWLEGEPLPRLLAESGMRTEALHRVGSALAELHAQAPKSLERRSVAPPVPVLSRAVAAVAALQPHLADRAARIACRVTEFLEDSPPPPCWIHGDFYADQLVVTADGIGVLDLDRTRRGDPAADLGEFLGHLESDALAGRLGPAELDALRAALLDGYGVGEGVLRVRVRVHSAAALLRLADAPFRHREEDWPRTMERILTRADEIAGSSVRSLDAPTRRRNRDGPPDEGGATARLARDSAFAFLLPALQPPHVERRLRQPLEAQLGEPLRIEVRGIRVLRHKPGRRCLLEFDVWIERAGSAPESMPVLGKVRARGLDERSYQLQRTLWGDGFGAASPDGIAVPEPIGVVPELKMWLQRRVPGESPLSLLSGGIAREVARRIVHAVDRLHRAELVPVRVHTVVDELRILRERFGQLAGTRPDLAPWLSRVLAGCERLTQNVPALSQRVVHRDFYHDQVLVDRDRIYLLDLDLVSRGNPALDVGNFLAHLVEHGLRTGGGPDAFAEAAAEIEAGFAALHPAADARAAVQTFTTLSLARLVEISTRIAERQPFTEALLELCEARMGRGRGDPTI
jgi:aminoglycoside phosphotransferase (APT) family kinase protein